VISRKRNGLWLVQLGQYIIGFGLASTVARSPRPEVPIVIAALVIINAALATGPLSAFRMFTAQTHRISTRIVIAIAVLAAVVMPIDTLTRATLLIVVLTLGAVSVRFGNGI